MEDHVPFSWKQAKKDSIRHKKRRIAIYEKTGRVMEAKRLRDKVTRMMEDDK